MAKYTPTTPQVRLAAQDSYATRVLDEVAAVDAGRLVDLLVPALWRMDAGNRDGRLPAFRAGERFVTLGRAAARTFRVDADGIPVEQLAPIPDCAHDNFTGDEGAVDELGRWPRRWRCDGCDALAFDIELDGRAHRLVPCPEHVADADAGCYVPTCRVCKLARIDVADTENTRMLYAGIDSGHVQIVGFGFEARRG